MTPMTIRPCGPDDRQAVLRIINDAAEAYRGIIPDDRWHDPYMPADELESEVNAGVRFWGCAIDGELAGVMGVQAVRDVVLIRHAYVAPSLQGRGAGRALIERLRADTAPRMLVGTWAAAVWAVRFYQRAGFALVGRDEIGPLLRTYWSIPERQVETSVVLASPANPAAY